MRILLPALLTILAIVPGRADNPKVNLKLEKVTAYDAAAALGKAANVTVELPERGTKFGQALPVDLEEKASFDWSNISFAIALRQLIARYGLRLQPIRGSGYQLYPSFQAPAGPAPKRVGGYDKNGVQMWVRRVSISDQRSVNFEVGGGFSNPGSMQVDLALQLREGDAAPIAGLENVVAKDDQGNLLSSPNFNHFRFVGPSFGFGNNFPDEWSGGASLPSPHPKAKKLLWVEGDVIAFKTYKMHDEELPLPVGPDQVLKRTIAGAEFEVSHFKPAPPAPPGGDANSRRFRPGPYLEVHISARQGWKLEPNGFALVGQSGRRYSGSGGGGVNGGNGSIDYTNQLRFRGIDEPIKGLVVTLLERGDPEKMLSFRLTDIPLPGDAPFVPQRAALGGIQRPGDGSRKPERPFQQEGGGTLVLPVRIGDKPAPAGVLSLGLAAKEGAEWSGTRWVDLTVEKDGIPRYESLKPGTYRVLRTFRLKDVPPVAEDGRWQNGEVTVDVVAGKETAVPPLAFTTTPAPAPARPAPAVKKPLPRR